MSRARNLAWNNLTSEWIAFLDDDCIPATDWFEQLDKAIDACPEASFVSGHCSPGDAPTGRDRLAASARPVLEERVRRGRWTGPQEIGFGVYMAVRRVMIEQLGGWDERLGPGTPHFPASEDMDFNYRLLKGGGVAYATPRVRAVHNQWRANEEIVPLYRGYAVGWSGFSMKHVRAGDILGGLWLWSLGVRMIARMFASSLKHRSRLRFAVACAQTSGFLVGTVKGVRRTW